MTDAKTALSLPIFLHEFIARQGPNLYELIDLGRPGVECRHCIARDYAEATRALITASLNKGMVDIMGHPVLFLMRHTVELFLKAIAPTSKSTRGNGHALDGYIEAIKLVAETHLGTSEVENLIARLAEFSAIDPKSMTFRFADGSRIGFDKADKNSLPGTYLAVDFECLPQQARELFGLLEMLSYQTRSNCNCFLCSPRERVSL